eukprot:15867-Heterococcus_DN1.PRE.2
MLAQCTYAEPLVSAVSSDESHCEYSFSRRTLSAACISVYLASIVIVQRTSKLTGGDSTAHSGSDQHTGPDAHKAGSNYPRVNVAVPASRLSRADLYKLILAQPAYEGVIECCRANDSFVEGQDAHSTVAQLLGRLSSEIKAPESPKAVSSWRQARIQIALVEHGLDGAHALKCLLQAAHYRVVVCDDELNIETQSD